MDEMKPLRGIRFAEDMDDGTQFALRIDPDNQGIEVVYVHGNGDSNESPIENETRLAVDHEGGILYQISFYEGAVAPDISIQVDNSVPAPPEPDVTDGDMRVLRRKIRESARNAWGTDQVGAMGVSALPPAATAQQNPPATEPQDIPAARKPSGAYDQYTRPGQTGGNAPNSKPNNQPKKPGGSLLNDILSEALGDHGNTGSTPPANNNGGNGDSGHRPPPPPRKMKHADRVIENYLAQYGTDLTDLAARGVTDPIIGRETEREMTQRALLRKKKSSIVFIGEAGVGKTAMFHALAQDIRDGKVPDELKNARVIELNMGGMTAGSKFRGEFEKRFMPIFEGLAERGSILNGQPVILAMDELHSALTAGRAEGAKGASDLIKPYLANGTLKIIGATTLDEYRQNIEKDKALVRRFEPITIDPPGKDETVGIIKGIVRGFAEHYAIAPMEDRQIDMLVNLTNRYLPARKQPEKAESMLDEAYALARMNKHAAVTDDDIKQVIAKAAKLPVSFLDQSESERVLRLEGDLPKKIFGQSEALDAVTKSMISAAAGLNDPDRPRAAFLFQGPTGVGKTETVYQLAETLYGSKDAVIRIDMANYADRHSATGLRGVTPGFIGFDQEGELTEQVRQKPYAVLLLDEIEKAHPDMFDMLLSALDKGEIKDSKGRTVDFRNITLVMTSNLGAQNAQSAMKASFSLASKGDAVEDPNSPALKAKREGAYKQARESFFKPEFLNRLEVVGGTVVFNALDRSAVNSVMEKQLETVSRRLRDNETSILYSLPVKLEFTDKLKDALREEGYNPIYGARPMHRAVRQRIVEPLSRWLLQNKAEILEKAASGATVTITMNAPGEAPTLQVEKPARKKPATPKPVAA